jgi:YesN/AraC family two-component response regulator
MPRKILVVDDDTDILLLTLDPMGAVAEASNGREALEKVKALKPDLMLLDVDMPEINGLEVLLAARKIDPRLQVVMLTAEADLAVAKKALDLGARSYITKPFDMRTVFEEVQRLLDNNSRGSGAAPDRPWRVTM